MSVPALLAVFSGFVGLAVLFLFGVEAYGRVRSLARTVARSSERIATAGATPAGTGQSDDEREPNAW